MPRPTKCRRVCYGPETLEFTPQNAAAREPIILTVDEYEAIRLIDKEGLSQAQCGQQMLIARTTVQRIYESARRKLATFLVEGLPLKIQGGDYRLCSGTELSCGHKPCFKRQLANINLKEKEQTIMRIAVAYENGTIFQHFGHTEQFKLYEVEQQQILSSQVINTNGTGHGALAQLLHQLEVDVLICGGIGSGAQNALRAAGITLYGGVSGGADQAVEALLHHTLEFQPDIQCAHHAHGEGHVCGDHGCGSHSCGNHTEE